MLDVISTPPRLSRSTTTVLRVVAMLRGAAHRPLQRLEVSGADGTVVLSGRLPSYYLKQLAQSLAAAVPGVERIENRTVVES